MYYDRDGTYTVTSLPEMLRGKSLMQIMTAQVLL